MNRLAHWMMRLYPSRWRRRYGDELDALLSDTGADARVVADLLRGGVRMQFSTWSFAKLAVVLGIGGMMLGAAGSFLIAPMYVSRATIEFTPALQQVAPIVLSRPSLASIINDPRLHLYKTELKTTPLEDVIEEMRGNIRIDAVAAASGMTISFRYPDARKAQQTVATLIGAFQSKSDLMQLMHPDAAGKHVAYLIDTASLATHPINAVGLKVALAGLGLGFLLALILRQTRKTGFAARRFGLAAVLLTLAGGLAGIAIVAADFVISEQADEQPGKLLGELYRSTAMMEIQNGTQEQFHALTKEVLRPDSLSMIINDPRLGLYQEPELKNKPREDVEEAIQKMLPHLSITPSDSNAHYFNISFDYRDRYKAQQTVQNLISLMGETYARMYGGMPDASVPAVPRTKVEILDKPSTPVLPVSPNRYQIAGEGGVAGLLAAAFIALVRRRWRPERDIPLDAVNG